MYGDHEDKFATWFRDSALYIELGPNDAIVVPEQAVDKRGAYFLACFGGEVLAEVQGGYVATGPEEWKRLSDGIDAFGKENGLLLGERAS